MEYGIAFTITPDSGPAVDFNAPDPVTGACYVVGDAQNFDGPALRQTIENRPGKPGGFVWPSIDAPQYPGLAGTIFANDTQESFEMDQALRALHKSMRSRWATLSWLNSDGVTRQMRVASVNYSSGGSIPKTFLLQMVSDQGSKDGDTDHHVTIAVDADETLANGGDQETWMTGKLYGPYGTARVTCVETGDFLEVSGTAVIPDGHFLEFDMLNETLYYDGDVFDYRGGYLTDVGDFFSVPDGDSTIAFTSDDAGSAYLTWRDAWS